jgi:hypothetical protein
MRRVSVHLSAYLSIYPSRRNYHPRRSVAAAFRYFRAVVVGLPQRRSEASGGPERAGHYVLTYLYRENSPEPVRHAEQSGCCNRPPERDCVGQARISHFARQEST